MYKAKPKLEIQTNDRTDADLEWLAKNEPPLENGELLNKTTIVNRAVQLYATLARARAAGQTICVGDSLDWI